MQDKCNCNDAKQAMAFLDTVTPKEALKNIGVVCLKCDLRWVSKETGAILLNNPMYKEVKQ